MDDELELGLAPSTKRRRALPGEPKDRRSWRLYKAKRLRLCDTCMTTVEKVNGWPIHAVDHALYVEKGPDGDLFLCVKHKEEREAAFRQLP